MGKMAQGVAARVVRLVLLASLMLVEARPLPGGEAAATLQHSSSPQPVHQLAIKGERHTSTHFMRSIVIENFGASTCSNEMTCADCGGNCSETRTCADGADVEPTSSTFCCWKHGFAGQATASSSFEACDRFTSGSYPAHIFLVRSIYSWLLSMYHEPYSYDGNIRSLSFAAFIRAPFVYSECTRSAIEIRIWPAARRCGSG